MTSASTAEAVSAPLAKDSQRTHPLALPAWMGFVVLVLYAVFIGGNWHGIYLVAFRSLSLAVVAVCLAAWFVASLRLPAWRPATAIWPTLVVPVATLALATAASRLPRLGLEYVAWAVLLVALYLLLARILATEFARARIGGLAAMLALVVGTVYAATVVGSWFEWWELVGGLAMPPLRPLFAGLNFGNPSAVLTVQVLLAAVACAGLGFATRGRRLVLAAIAVLTLAVVVMSGSRAGWLAIAGATGIVSGVWILFALRSGSLARLLSQRGVRLVAGAAVVAGLVGAVLLAPAVLLRFSGAGDGGRLQYFTTALRMFEDAPVLGTGPGTWAVQRVAYTEPGELDWYITHAHNMYLQTLAELGLVGALAGLVAIVPVAWLIYRGMRDRAAVSRRWAWAAFFGLVYLGLHSLLDFYMNMPAVMLLAAIPIATLDASSDRGIGLGNVGARVALRTGQVARAALWLACLAAVLLLAWAESAAWRHEAAVAAVHDSDWRGARGPADAAALADPEMPAYQMTRGLVASAQEDWQVAAEAYRRAALVDDIPMSWLGLAQAQIGLGAADAEVVESIERARRSGSQQPAIAYAAGRLYDRLGMAGAADEAYAIALAAFPSLAADPSWMEDGTLAPRFAGIIDLAMGRAPEQAWEIALMSGDAARAHALNEAGGGSAFIDLVIEAWEGHREAIEEVYARADAAPGSLAELAWAERVAARAGDPEAAKRYGRLVNFASIEGGVIPGAEIRVDRTEWLRHVPAGTLTWYASQWLYRRPGSLDLIPPGLPRLVHAERDPGEDAPPEP